MGFAQLLSWHSKFSPNNVTDLAWFNNQWYAGTQSGLIHFDPLSPENTVSISKEDGLSSVYITALVTDSVRNQLIIGYQNGELQFLSAETGEFKSVSDIRTSKNYSNKQINRLVVRNNKLWIATEFGVVIYNLDERFFEVDFSRIADQSTIRINDIEFQFDRIWLASSLGVYSASVSEDNLKNPAVWSLLAGIPKNVASSLYKSGDSLYIGMATGLYRYNGILTQSLTSWTSSAVLDIAMSKPDTLFLLTNRTGTEEWKILKFTPSGSLLKTTAVENGSRLSGSSSGIACGSTTAGVFNGTTSGWFALSGMSFSSVSDLKYDGKNYVGSSGKGNKGFMVRDSNGEYNVNRSGYPEIPLVEGFYGVTYYEGKPLVATWGGGLIEVNPDRSITLINNKNSGLVGILGDADFVTTIDLNVDQNGDLWILNYVPTDGKALKVKRKGKSWTQLGGFSFPGNSGNSFKKHWIDPFGNHWLEAVSVEGHPTVGLLVYSESGTPDVLSDDKYVVLTNKPGTGNLPSTEINDVAFDGSGAAWIATPAGISVLYNANYILSQTGSINAVPVYSIQNELVKSVFVDVSGKKWIALESGIVVLSEQSEQIETIYTATNSDLLSNSISKLLYNEESGEVYALTDFGLSIFNSPKIKGATNPETPVIYPNPFLPEQHHSVWLTGLSKDSEVLIMNMAGKIIRKLAPVSGFVNSWDGRDSDGNLVSSGIYIISYRDQGKEKATTGKVAVIR
ncbi:MAG: hypothetical protein J0L62_08890 [Bacteroidetes bacterium]|nr:hypothetical protein [Bacteroidota bacterium]